MSDYDISLMTFASRIAIRTIADQNFFLHSGASGSLFGIIALVLLDLLYTWRERRKPLRDLLWIIIDIIIAFALGLLPGLDNFSHIGGFLMGLVFGVCILRSPTILRERIGLAGSSYNTVTNNLHNDNVHSRNHSGGSGSSSNNNNRNGNGGTRRSSIAGIKDFVRDPLSFFRGRKPLWWGWWLMRAGALVGVLVGFIVLLNNFYEHRVDCEWCKYLSCIVSIFFLSFFFFFNNSQGCISNSCPLLIQIVILQNISKIESMLIHSILNRTLTTGATWKISNSHPRMVTPHSPRVNESTQSTGTQPYATQKYHHD